MLPGPGGEEAVELEPLRRSLTPLSRMLAGLSRSPARSCSGVAALSRDVGVLDGVVALGAAGGAGTLAAAVGVLAGPSCGS